MLDVARPPSRIATIGPGASTAGAVVVGDAQRPAAAGGRSGGGHVTAEGDEDAGAGRVVHALRAAVGGVGLGDRAEVELDAGRQGHEAAPAVELDTAPAGGGHDADAARLAADADEREVAIPAEPAHRAPDGGVDVAAGRGGRPQRDGKHVEQERSRRERTPGRAVQPGELGVVAEAAAGQVERAQLGGDELGGLVERVGPRDGDLREHADRGEGARGDGRRRRGVRRSGPRASGRAANSQQDCDGASSAASGYEPPEVADGAWLVEHTPPWLGAKPKSSS